MIDPWVAGIVGVLCLVAMWSYFTAQRLNRLHIRTDAARQQLLAALDQRSLVFAAITDTLPPAATLRVDVNPKIALEQRAEAEAALSFRINAHPRREDPALQCAMTRVELAIRFYNDAVTATRALRLRPLVRLLHLGGTAALPSYFDPAGLTTAIPSHTTPAIGDASAPHGDSQSDKC
ncbi:hypothetical protein ACFPVT_06395 [Corynebacterium choanae]|uniref:LemA family protein n=1 Tax=Corynebacterium choanae TaxID=1862358 RepID=A0A3G6J761_9CORY|nr:hypothetical protein [Corynebacterium choanae]AZA13709.1 hypothetical protein CCHOA_06550 [Corynebacterium choanae]